MPLRRFHMLGLGGAIGALGALILVAPLALSLVVGWISVADGVLFVLLGLRRALPGGYVRPTADGVHVRHWRARQEAFVAWSRVAAVEVVDAGFGVDGWRYPVLRLVDGRTMPLLMLSSAVERAHLLDVLFRRRRPFDRHFEANLTVLRDARDAHRADGSV